MKRIFIFVLIISILTSMPALAKEEEFLSVSDGAGMLSEVTERYIYTQNKILSDKTGARIIIATAPESGELSVTEYAQNLYDELGVNRIGRNNCIFIFMCETEKDYCLKVSDGISAALTEAYAQSCLVDFMETDFEKGNYDKAVIKTFNAFALWYADKYRMELELTEDMSDYRNIIKTEKERKLLRTVLITAAAVVAFVIAVGALIRFRRKKREERLLRKRQERRRRYAQSLHGK